MSEKDSAKLGRPPFVPTADDYILAERLFMMGFSIAGVAEFIFHPPDPSNPNKREPICAAICRREFGHFIKKGDQAIIERGYSKFLEALDNGEQWAIRRVMSDRLKKYRAPNLVLDTTLPIKEQIDQVLVAGAAGQLNPEEVRSLIMGLQPKESCRLDQIKELLLPILNDHPKLKEILENEHAS